MRLAWRVTLRRRYANANRGDLRHSRRSLLERRAIFKKNFADERILLTGIKRLITKEVTRLGVNKFLGVYIFLVKVLK